MRYGCAPVVALVAACYQPGTSPGAPCGPNGECPSGLECRAGICVVPGSGLDDADVDADPVDAPDAGPAYVPWGTAVPLPTGISSETDPSITANLLTIVFMSETTDDLYIGIRGSPTGALTVAPLAVVNSAAKEKSPEISPDGLTLYFTSDRGGNFDVYRSTFATVWSGPTLMTDLSTAGDEVDVAISPDGLTAVVIDDQATNRFLIHTRTTTTQAFGNGVHHPELSVLADAGAPTVTNGGEIIYLHAGGTRDIYIATRKPNGSYKTPTNVAELNTGGRDAAPFVLQTNGHMIFERDSDLYETTRP